jgi:hypothetical protein
MRGTRPGLAEHKATAMNIYNKRYPGCIGWKDAYTVSSSQQQTCMLRTTIIAVEGKLQHSAPRATRVS